MWMALWDLRLNNAIFTGISVINWIMRDAWLCKHFPLKDYSLALCEHALDYALALKRFDEILVQN